MNAARTVSNVESEGRREGDIVTSQSMEAITFERVTKVFQSRLVALTDISFSVSVGATVGATVGAWVGSATGVLVGGAAGEVGT